MRSEPGGGPGGSTKQEPAPELGGLTRLRARLDPGIARNLELGTLFELFLVTAVVSLLLIRGLLALSGFPQVGGGGLHIAHMLWGGLLMLASLLLLLLFIDRRLLFWAAFLSGVGFGTFIDELGKFVTSDNDYFFRPAIAIVYVIFVLLFLVFRALEHRRRHSERELLANAFDIVREAVLHGRRAGHSAPVLAYLREHAGDDPLLVAFREILERTPPGPPPLPAPLRRLRSLALRLYVALVDARGLDRVLAVIVTAYAAFLLADAAVATGLYLGGPPRALLGKGWVAFSGLFLSTVVSLLLVGVATWHLLRGALLGAMQWLRRGVVVDLLLGQVFAFYLLQFGALVGLAVDVAVLLVVTGAIRSEQRLEHHRHQPGRASPSAG
ncbi:MAG TPA: hypothetical protein VKF59_07210 [Candidatus Dormibacteraeota bacterium]|nr:hypothetical protein [Candidatus Dormibacteraeota bacterium]